MKRVRVPEEMDDPHLDVAAHQHALKSLARANRLLGVDHAVRQQIHNVTPQACSILDLGCGGGALLDSFVINNRRTGSARRTGIDRSESALRVAARNIPAVTWITADARRLPLAADSFDVVVCTLLLHHFDPDDVVRVLTEAGRVARVAVLISDLARSRLAWLATWLFTRLLSRSWVFHADGPRSVRAAYTPSEMRALAGRANLQGTEIISQFPFRMLLIWFKPQAAIGADNAL